MKIKLTQYNPRKVEQTITKVSHSRQKKNTRKSNKDLSKFICYTCDERGRLTGDCQIETKIYLTRGRETRKDIMLMLQKMMSLPRRESNKKVMKNMC